jgi:hypothetical protein
VAAGKSRTLAKFRLDKGSGTMTCNLLYDTQPLWGRFCFDLRRGREEHRHALSHSGQERKREPHALNPLGPVSAVCLLLMLLVQLQLLLEQYQINRMLWILLVYL